MNAGDCTGVCRGMSLLARALGFGDGDIVVVPHLDDLGMCHGGNLAFLELAAAEQVTCGSVMVPCPWFAEIAEAAAADPALDLGVHLTLTSEWWHYRWRPLTTAGPSSGLTDANGFFWRDAASLAAHLVPEAAEAEMRAQIERARAAGIVLTHLDAHMGAALLPALLPATLRLGREYRLPVILSRRIEDYAVTLGLGPVDPVPYAAALAAADAGNKPVFNAFRITPGVPTPEADTAYLDLAASLEPGVTFLALHAAAPGEIEAIVPEHAHCRTNEYAILRSGAFSAELAARGVRTIGMRRMRDLAYGSA